MSKSHASALQNEIFDLNSSLNVTKTRIENLNSDIEVLLNVSSKYSDEYNLIKSKIDLVIK